MANATPSFLGKANNSGDDNALFLKLFSGEVLSAFSRANKMLPMTTVRTIANGKSATFPLVGTATAEYHTPGAEITGNVINANEKIITIDDMLIAHSFISELDELKNHYDVRQIYSKELGEALARKVDDHLLQLAVLGARSSGLVTGRSGGSVITDADANTNAGSLIDSIFEGAEDLDNNSVPENDRFCVVSPDIYYKIVNNDKILNRDFGGVNGVYADGTVLKVAGINIVKSTATNTAFTNLSSASTTGHNNTYTGNFSTTVAVIFHKSSIGSVKLMDLKMDTEFDLRRSGTLMVGKMAMGSGFLRPEAMVEIKTS